MGVNSVKISDVVAVIGTGFVKWADPNGGDAKVFEILDFIDDSLYVSS